MRFRNPHNLPGLMVVNDKLVLAFGDSRIAVDRKRMPSSTEIGRMHTAGTAKYRGSETTPGAENQEFEGRKNEQETKLMQDSSS